MKKLLIVTQTVDESSPTLGFFIDWIREFAAACDKVEVIALEVRGRPVLPANVTVRSMGKEDGVSRPRRLLNYWRHLRRGLPDSEAVLAHMCPEYLIAGWPFFAAAKMPIALWFTHKAVNWKLRLAVRIADLVFTASPESFRLPTPKLRVVGHGIIWRGQPHAPDPTSLRLLTVGRVAEIKGLETMIEALRRFNADAPPLPWTFDIVGAPAVPRDAAYLERLRRQAVDAGLADQVAFVGPTAPAGLPAVYGSHDVFLHASETGSLDKTVLEALGYGLIVVSSNEASGFLDEAMRFPSKDAATLALRLRHWAEVIKASRWDARPWTEKIRREHGLGGLAARVLAELRRSGSQPSLG
jgi:glycosyltransferase involved in cell wall biosynthesis